MLFPSSKIMISSQNKNKYQINKGTNMFIPYKIQIPRQYEKPMLI